ncbi:MAG: DUF1062 domain-containing protein [Lacrimispora sp.]|uniref:DUF1062 domain-containing protein n=1 Tax=Lacrimispora sp. TaxID=2719234 RepID=UPI0039E4B4A8
MHLHVQKQWIITPANLPSIIRRCPKCGIKTEFKNSKKFRVNANGRLIDVWLIYRCSKCETSWNMTVWERAEAGSLDEEEYQGFLSNDPALAEKYGNDRTLFAGNKAETSAERPEYSIEERDTPFSCGLEYHMEVHVKIPAGFDLRVDALLVRQLGVSRNKIKTWCEKGLVFNQGNLLSPKTRVKDGMILQLKKEVLTCQTGDSIIQVK